MAMAHDEVAEFLNVTLAGQCLQTRQHARMIIVWTMDAAVAAEKVHRHNLTGITLTEGTAVPRRQAAANAAAAGDDDDDEAATGFVFLSDEQVRRLAGGIMATAVDCIGREREQFTPGVGIAAWLQRAMGLRIGEALGAEKADFRTRKDGSHYLRLRARASRSGQARVPLKHRRAGEGRDVPVPDFIWDMVAAMGDGPLCPSPAGKTRYMCYATARRRFADLTKAMKVSGYTTHSVRHQFATEALEAGENIANISAVLGHASVATRLKVYIHPTGDAGAKVRTMMNARWASLASGGDPAAAGQQAAGQATELATLRAQVEELRAELAQAAQPGPLAEAA